MKITIKAEELIPNTTEVLSQESIFTKSADKEEHQRQILNACSYVEAALEKRITDEITKREAVRFHTVLSLLICSDCAGVGHLPDNPTAKCMTCHGTGRNPQEHERITKFYDNGESLTPL